MTHDLADEIRQTRPFDSLQQAAHLNIARTAAALEHALAEAMKPFDLTPTQYNVLRILRGAGPEGLCRNDVRDRMVAPVPDTTRLLDRMEAAGLLQRARDASDRRYVKARITDEGLRLLDRVDGPVQALHSRHFAGIEETALAGLIDVLDRVRSSLRSEPGT